MDQQRQPGTPGGTWSVELAVCAEMVFLELPVEERIRRIADLGFQVEIWDWTRKDIDAPVRPASDRQVLG